MNTKRAYPGSPSFAFFPAPPTVKQGAATLEGTAEGVFTRFMPQGLDTRSL